MLRRGAFVALGALAARVLADGSAPVAGRAVNVSADVDVGVIDVDVDAELDVNENGVEVYAGLKVGSPLFCKWFSKHCGGHGGGGGGYPEVSTTTVTVTETAAGEVTTVVITDTETYTVSVPFTETIVDEATVTRTIVDEDTVTNEVTRTIVDENTVTRTIVDENTVTRTVVDENTVTRTVVDEETVTLEVTRTIVDENTVTRTVVDQETITQEVTRTIVDENTVTRTIVDDETVTRDVTRTIEQTETAYVPTTIVETLTVPTSFYITITVDHTIVSTVLTTEFQTITTTIVSSVPVTITQPGATVTKPGVTITAAPPPTSPPVTVTITEVTACPAPTNPPNVRVAAFNPKSDLTWGCKPGFICSPPKPGGCNLWADSPADNYVCAPEECVPAPPVIPVKWAENETAYYPPSDTYFNLDPRAFGLSFDIFEPPEEYVTKIHGHKTTITKEGNYGSQSSITHYPPASETPYEHDYRPRPRDVAGSRPVIRRSIVRRDGDGTVYPAVCFDDCNAAYLETQRSGKNDALCKAGSAFLSNVAACQACVTLHDKDEPSSDRVYLPEKFAQFIQYCGGSEAEPTNGGGDGGGPESQVESQTVTTRSQGGVNTDTSIIPITPTTSPTATPTQDEPTNTPPAPDTSEPASTTPPAPGTSEPGSTAGPTDEVSPTGGAPSGSATSGGDVPPTTTRTGGGGGGGGGAGGSTTETPSGDSPSGTSPGGSSPSGGGSGGGGGSGNSPGDGTGDKTEEADPSLPNPTSTEEGPVQAKAASLAPGLLMAILPILGGLFFI